MIQGEEESRRQDDSDIVFAGDACNHAGLDAGARLLWGKPPTGGMELILNSLGYLAGCGIYLGVEAIRKRKNKV